MSLLFLAALFLSTSALAQTSITTGTPTSAEAPATNWKISYFAEWQGPAVGHIDFTKSQNAGGAPFYSSIDHSFKLGYGVTKDVTLGTQFRGSTLFTPDAGFSFSDQRFYAQWGHMINTSDVDMSGKVAVELPTTDSSKTAGKILAFKINFNFELKTALRNWSFTCDTFIKPYFYNDPITGGGKTDLEFALLPYVTLDLTPNLQLLFEGSFDGNHNYNAAFYDYASANNDYLDIGPLLTINSHINTNLALRFFSDSVSFKTAAIYANVTASL